MSEELTVLEFLESAPAVPLILTMERTTQSKYMFYLLVRHARQRGKSRPRFYTYTAREADLVKSLIEEHSVFGDQDGTLYILEGFSQRFVENLTPPPGTTIVAETDGGQLKAPNFVTSRSMVRGILKVLMDQLRLKGGKLSLSGLLKLDWTGMRAFEEFEPLLRRAKILDMEEEELELLLEGREWANVLELTKRGRFKEIVAQTERMGGQGAYRHLMSTLADMLQYRALRTMGYEPKKAADQLDLGWRRAQEVETANIMLTAEDLAKLADRAVRLDQLMLRKPLVGVQLYFFNNPISVRK